MEAWDLADLTGGRFALGHAKRDALEIPAPWREAKQLKHGDSVMRFFEV